MRRQKPARAVDARRHNQLTIVHHPDLLERPQRAQPVYTRMLVCAP